MKTIAFLALILPFGFASAEVYKCVSANKTIYADAPCKSGVVKKVILTYSTPTQDEVEKYQSDLRRRSDDSDARTSAKLAQYAEMDRQAEQRRRDREYGEAVAARQKRLDDIQRRLDEIQLRSDRAYDTYHQRR